MAQTTIQSSLPSPDVLKSFVVLQASLSPKLLDRLRVYVLGMPLTLTATFFQYLQFSPHQSTCVPLYACSSQPHCLPYVLPIVQILIAEMTSAVTISMTITMTTTESLTTPPPVVNPLKPRPLHQPPLPVFRSHLLRRRTL